MFEVTLHTNVNDYTKDRALVDAILDVKIIMVNAATSKVRHWHVAAEHQAPCRPGLC